MVPPGSGQAVFTNPSAQRDPCLGPSAFLIQTLLGGWLLPECTARHDWYWTVFLESGYRCAFCSFYLAGTSRGRHRHESQCSYGPRIIRPSIFYGFCRRGRRARVLSKEVNAKPKLLSAETGRWDQFIKPDINFVSLNKVTTGCWVRPALLGGCMCL